MKHLSNINLRNKGLLKLTVPRPAIGWINLVLYSHWLRLTTWATLATGHILCFTFFISTFFLIHFKHTIWFIKIWQFKEQLRNNIVQFFFVISFFEFEVPLLYRWKGDFVATSCVNNTLKWSFLVPGWLFDTGFCLSVSILVSRPCLFVAFLWAM